MSEAETTTLCRDCLARSAPLEGRCGSCGSPRMVHHPELMRLSVAHVDCDAFYAAIEKRDDPSLADQPVIIGGGRRGVVATACYVARISGVRSAMPMFKALKACPHAVVIPPNMAKYVSVARQVRELMLAMTPAVEPLSIDEAFLDLSGTERLHGAPAAVTLARLQSRLEKELGITASVGLSHNKFLAKIASDLEKPRGFAVIGKAETHVFLAHQPVSVLWGVGQAMQARLARDGISRIADLQRIEARVLQARYGSIGLRIAALAQGDDARSVISDRKAKTISAETTFEVDLARAAELLPPLRLLAEKVSARLKQQRLAGRVVVLKLKTSAFKLRTRNMRLESPTHLADRIFHAGRELLLRELDGTHFRLIGIGTGDFAAGEAEAPVDLIDSGAAKRAKAERAIDTIRERYGQDGLRLGLTFTAKPKRRDDQGEEQPSSAGNDLISDIDADNA